MVPGKMFCMIRGAFSNWQDVCSPMSQADNMKYFWRNVLEEIVIVQIDDAPKFEGTNFASKQFLL